MRDDGKLRTFYIRFAAYALLILTACVFLLPLLFMAMSALKDNAAIFHDARSIRAFLPTGDIALDNYESIFRHSRIGRFFLNSVLITLITVGLGLIVNSMAAFALARLHWAGRAFALSAVITLLIVPLEAIAIPMLLLVSRLPWITVENGTLVFLSSWLNTLHVQIVPFVAHAFSIYLFYQFFRDIPRDFDEAAYVDGANPFQVYRHVIVPLSGPVFATVAILQALAMWNQ
ncbi:MAG: carbohydrate ABC transporter permease, partial [Alphaproteobacteria bacterium]